VTPATAGPGHLAAMAAGTIFKVYPTRLQAFFFSAQNGIASDAGMRKML